MGWASCLLFYLCGATAVRCEPPSEGREYAPVVRVDEVVVVEVEAGGLPQEAPGLEDRHLMIPLRPELADDVAQEGSPLVTHRWEEMMREVMREPEMPDVEEPGDPDAERCLEFVPIDQLGIEEVVRRDVAGDDEVPDQEGEQIAPEERREPDHEDQAIPGEEGDGPLCPERESLSTGPHLLHFPEHHVRVKREADGQHGNQQEALWSHESEDHPEETALLELFIRR